MAALTFFGVLLDGPELDELPVEAHSNVLKLNLKRFLNGSEAAEGDGLGFSILVIVVVAEKQKIFLVGVGNKSSNEESSDDARARLIRLAELPDRGKNVRDLGRFDRPAVWRQKHFFKKTI